MRCRSTYHVGGHFSSCTWVVPNVFWAHRLLFVDLFSCRTERGTGYWFHGQVVLIPKARMNYWIIAAPRSCCRWDLFVSRKGVLSNCLYDYRTFEASNSCLSPRTQFVWLWIPQRWVVDVCMYVCMYEFLWWYVFAINVLMCVCVFVFFSIFFKIYF